MAGSEAEAARNGSRRWVAGAVVATVLALLAVVLVSRGHDTKDRVQATTSSDASTSDTVTTTAAAGPTSSESPNATVATSALEAPTSTEPQVDASPEQPTDPSTEPSTAGPSLGPDAILYVASSPYQQLWAINPDGSGNTLIADGLDLWNAGWAPGHQQIAWTEAGQGEQGRRIHVRSVDGASDRVLVPTNAQGTVLAPFYDAQWSPDGSTIAYTCQKPTEYVAHVCTVDVATGQAHDVTAEFSLSTFDDYGNQMSHRLGAWSPDGRLLSYVEESPDPQHRPSTLHVVDVATGEHWDLGPDDTSRSRGVFTPDGAWVLSLEANGMNLSRVPVHGGTRVPIPGVTTDAWDRSPDGEWFLAQGQSSIVIFNLSGETRFVPGTQGARAVSW